MVSKRLSLFGLISAAALVSGVLIGCGGSSATAGPAPVVAATGGITTSSGSTTTSVSSSTSPQQVQVTTTGGATVNAVVPPGQPALTPASVVATIPANQPIINGLTFGPSVHRAPTAHPLNISYDGTTWVWSGVNVNADGSLDNYLVLAPGYVYLQAVGPFTMVGGGSSFLPGRLTMQTLVFGIPVDATGIPGIPTDLQMKLPGNNGTTSNGQYVNVTYPTPNFATGIGTLTITWPGVKKQQVKTVIGGLVSYSDINAGDSANDHVPPAGVTEIRYILVH